MITKKATEFIPWFLRLRFLSLPLLAGNREPGYISLIEKERELMSETIGFIGLGGMGSAMAANLLKAGFALKVYNRAPQRAEPLVALGATRVNSIAEAAEEGGIVVTMLTNDAAVQEVVSGDSGFGSALGSGGIHVSMSTIAPETSRHLAALHREQQSHYVAAPVFGKPDAAAAQKLWIATSGPAEAKTRIQPVLDAMGQGVYDFGNDPGAANIVKLTGNFMLGAAIEAMGEAFTLAQKNGIPRTAVYEFFSETLFNCPVYKNYGKQISEEQYQPIGAVPSLIRKDFGLILQAAQNSAVPMPLASLVHDRLTAMVAKGREDRDWAGFAGEISENAGL
jgi:3-hydroxyisobutyrate dehydrogenase-like beta-hydroxyacid dehydrogenase